MTNEGHFIINFFGLYLKYSVLLLLILPYLPCHAGENERSPFRHREVLDSKGKYVLEWVVEWEERQIVFDVTVQTKGYVGLGLSRKGEMSGADIVIGGVSSDGKPYFTDRHAVGNQLPEIDPSQDWKLHTAWENGSHTFLRFSRAFHTCDAHDLEINDDYIAILWAYGEKDNDIEYHYHNRGVFNSYLLDPDLKPSFVKSFQPTQNEEIINHDLKMWTISRSQAVPAKDTTYVCTMHKAPNHSRKHHIVGFNSVLESVLEHRHIHHFLLHRCHSPNGQDPSTIFQQHVSNPGEECYVLNSHKGRIPVQYCREVMHEWAVGAGAVFFPDHVGIPFAEAENEYYMLQMHYNNPEALPGIQLKFSLEIFYTEHLREHDAGLLYFGINTPGSPSIMLPPSTINHVVYGHCGAGCTQKWLPPGGIHAFAAKLHTHLAGRGGRMIHIRGNRELPWITADDYYNFNFQPVRVLRKERTILPGDQLIKRCVYETTNRNGSVTVGGFSTRNEMCNGFLWYYNKLPGLGICASDIKSDIYRHFVGIRNTTWSDSRIENIVTAPSQNAGLTVSEAGNRIDWTINKREEISKLQRFLPQISQCHIVTPTVGEDDPSSQPQLVNLRSRGWKRSKDLTNEIANPEYEYVSTYQRDIVPYERPERCGR